MVQAIADCYLAGVSTRWVDKLVKQLGIDGISKSQVSQLAKLDEHVAAWRSGPLEGAYTYVWMDALTQNVREGGRVVNVAVVHAVGVNAQSYGKTLGIEVVTSEDGVGWTAFLRGLVARGASGCSLASPTPTAVWKTRSPRPCLVSAGSGACQAFVYGAVVGVIGCGA